MHRTIPDGVYSAYRSSAICFQPAFDQVHNSRFTTTDRAHKQQDAFTDFQTLGGGVEILNNLLKRFLNTKDLIAEKVKQRFARSACCNACIHNHVINALMGKTGYFWLFRSNLKVLGESTLPL